MTLRKMTHALRMLLIGLCVAAPAHAAKPYPQEKPITIVLPYATGGAADLLARLAGDAIQKALGQTVVVQSMPGAGGVLGAEHVARAKPDGYTLLLTASGSMAVNPFTYSIKYDPIKDFDHVSILVDLPFALVARPGGIDSLETLVSRAKAQPGALTFGNAGMGTQQHLTQLMLAKAAGIELAIVPYKGSMPALNDLLGGHLDLVLDNTGVQTPFIQSGKVKALFVTSPQRVAALPDVPTAQEAGLTGFEAVAWFGLAAPSGTPKAAIDAIQQAIAGAFADPQARQTLNDRGMLAVASTPEAANARVRQDYATFGELAKTISLKAY